MKSYNPKVLVASPTYEGKDYIFEKHFECIKNFDYDNYDYVYLDNTEGSQYTEVLQSRGANVLHIPRGSNSRDALANAQNVAFKLCIEKDYDYLLFVESDLLPPKDTIKYLLGHNKQIVGATYFIGTEGIKYPCIFIEAVNDRGERATRPLLPEEVQYILKYPGLKKVHGMGFGCTLIRRDIVSRFPLWHDERYADKHSDVYFYLALHRAKIPVFVDSGFIVEHYPSKWADVKDR